MKILISSSNKDKLKEFKNILGNEYDLVTKSMIVLEDFDVEEDGDSLDENAYIKAKALFDLKKGNVLADDTGLFVEALNGDPGVFSARYAGEDCSYQDNVDKLLFEMKDIENIQNRKAYFQTSICFIREDGEVFYAKGILDGYIDFKESGENGFGYDPIFLVKDLNKSLASLSPEEKNQISHRKRAIENIKKVLKDME